MHLTIDPELCLGCGQCEEFYPDNYAMGDDGKSYVKKSDGGEGMIDLCPGHAIKPVEG